MIMLKALLHVCYQISLTRSPPTRSADDQGEGFLLNSYDRTLVIKQISSEDVADMHNILSEYHQVSSSRGPPEPLSERSGGGLASQALPVLEVLDPNGPIFRSAGAASGTVSRTK